MMAGLKMMAAFLALLLSLTAYGENIYSPPVIGSSKVFTLTCSIGLYCLSTCPNNLTIDWLLKGEPLGAMNLFLISNQSSYPFVNSSIVSNVISSNGMVSVAHAGNYSCVVSFDSGPSSILTLVVAVRVPAPVVVVTNATSSFNNESSLYCTASIAPDIPVLYSYSWLPLNGYENMLTVVTNNSSVGQYTCNVTVSYNGTDAESIYVLDSVSVSSVGYLFLTVTGNIVVNVDTNSSAVAGNHFVFTCTAIPPPGLTTSDLTFNWFHPNGSAMSAFFLNSVTLSDAGIYSCNTSASHSNPYVLVQVPPSSALFILTVRIPTPIVTAYGNIAIAGMSTNISCVVSLPNFNSYSTDTVIEYSYLSANSNATTPVKKSSHTFNYFINPFTSYAGIYVCAARILYQGEASPVINSTVNTSTAILYVQIPQLSILLPSVITVTGNSVEFHCAFEIPYFVDSSSGLSVANHQLSPSIGTRFAGLQLLNDIVILRFIIDDVIDLYGGGYACIAQLSHSSPYILTSPPGIGVGILYVTNISILSSTQTLLDYAVPYDRLIVNCSVAITPTPTTYNVSFSWPILSSNNFTSVIVTNNHNVSMMTLTGLGEGNYQVHCIANITVHGSINTVGTSHSINITVKGVSLPVRPVINNIIVQLNTVTIFWNIPEVTYSLENYTVLYGLSPDNLTMSSSTINTISDYFLTANNIPYNVTIGGLVSTQDYYFQIVSENTVGITYSEIGNFSVLFNGLTNVLGSSDFTQMMFVTPSQSMPISTINDSLAVQSQLPIIRSTSFSNVDSSSMPKNQSSTPVFSFSVISESSNIVSDSVVTRSSTTATTHSELLTMTPVPTVPVSIQSDSFNGKLDVLLHDSATISFTITGGFPLIEPHQISWFFMRHRNDTFITIETNALSEDRLSLMIERVQLVNGGIYKISATNDAGTVESTTLLHVIVKAKLLEIVYESSLIIKGKGESISFNCTADGISLPLITWRRNGQLITGNARRKIESSGISEGFRSSIIPGVMQVTSILTITNLNQNDNGNYSCRADNEAQIGDTSVLPYSLQVVEALPVDYCGSSPCQYHKQCYSLSDSYYCKCLDGYTGRNCDQEVIVFIAPQIIQVLKFTSGKLYTSARLICEAIGSPNPSVQWYKDNKLVINNNSDPSLLSINELDLNYRGFYHCEATSVINGIKNSVNSSMVLLNITDILQYKVIIQFSSIQNESASKIHFIQNANYYLAGSNTSISFFMLIVALSPYSYVNDSMEIIVTLFTENTQDTEKHMAEINHYMSLLNAHIISNISVNRVERFDGCPSTVTIIPSISGDKNLDITITWPETNIGVNVVVDCPCGSNNSSIGGHKIQGSRYCGGDFTYGGVWNEPNVTLCNFSDLTRSICNLLSLPSEERVEDLKVVTSNVSKLNTNEVTASAIVLVSTTHTVSGNLSLSVLFLDVVDRLSLVDRSTLNESQILFNSSGKILEALDVVVQALPINNISEPVSIAQRTFAVSVQQIGIDELKMYGQNFSVTQTNSSELLFTEMKHQSSVGSVSLPESLFDFVANNNATLRIANVAFLLDSLFVRRQTNGLEVTSIIISTTIVGIGVVQKLTHPVQLVFQIFSNNNGSSLQCQFWNQSLDDGYGQWSKEGCTTTVNDETVTCKCNHLTNFAILLDASPSIEPTTRTDLSLSLDSVSYIGIIISLLCLIITGISYATNKKLRASNHGQLLIGLCCALIGLYATFLIAQHSSHIFIVCIIVAAMLQYFFLVAFMLMASEAINLYFNLVVILGKKIAHFTLKAMIVSWVMPIFIVVFSFAPSYDNYYNNHFCRAFGFSFYIGMIAPFLIIYTFNWIMFLVIACSFVYRKVSSNSKNSKQQKMSKFLKIQFGISIVLLLLFGLGWGIGLLATQDIHSSQEIHDVIAGLFIFITAFHGFFIFVMQCLRSKEVRSSWKNWILRLCRISNSHNLHTHKNDTRSRSTMKINTLRSRSVHLSVDEKKPEQSEKAELSVDLPVEVKVHVEDDEKEGKTAL